MILIFWILSFGVLRKLFSEKFSFGVWLFMLLMICKDFIGFVLLKFCVLIILKFRLVAVRLIFFKLLSLLQKFVVVVFLIVSIFIDFIVSGEDFCLFEICCLCIFIILVVMMDLFKEILSVLLEVIFIILGLYLIQDIFSFMGRLFWVFSVKVLLKLVMVFFVVFFIMIFVLIKGFFVFLLNIFLFRVICVWEVLKNSRLRIKFRN